jgi:hypothetical protein
MQYHPPSWLPASENGKRTDYYAHLRSEVIEAIPHVGLVPRGRGGSGGETICLLRSI